MKQTLLRQLEALELPTDAADTLCAFGQAVVKQNEVMNLTAITEPGAVAKLHLADSVTVLKCADLRGKTLIDVGCGAGFPGVPVKIACPEMKLTLLDSLNKRLVFLTELCKEIGVKSTCVHARAEDGGKDKKHREKYDFACARAVASLRNLSEYCLPFVKVGGAFIALKGPDWKEELAEAKNAIGTMGGKVEKVEEFTLPDESKRAILVIRKVSQTPPQFPRTAAKMTKKPIV